MNVYRTLEVWAMYGDEGIVTALVDIMDVYSNESKAHR
jgi:hypothetical protein